MSDVNYETIKQLVPLFQTLKDQLSDEEIRLVKSSNAWELLDARDEVFYGRTWEIYPPSTINFFLGQVG